MRLFEVFGKRFQARINAEEVFGQTKVFRKENPMILYTIAIAAAIVLDRVFTPEIKV